MLRIYDDMLDVIELLKPLLRAIAAYDRPLADQLSRNSKSVALNLAEGSGSWGGIRMARYRTALGSARETVSALQVAHRAGYIPPMPQAIEVRMNRVIGTLVNITK
jgi:four helix bundle protein